MNTTQIILNVGEFTEIPGKNAFNVYNKNIDGYPKYAVVVFVAADEQPESFGIDTPIIGSVTQGASFKISGLDTKLWAVAVNSPAVIDVTELFTSDRSIFDSAELGRSFNRSIVYTLDEYYTGIGFKYSMSEIYPLSSGEEIFIGIVMPPVASGKISAFSLRHIESYDGEAQFSINQDITSGVVGVGDPIDIHYENRAIQVPPITDFRYLGNLEPIGGEWIEEIILPSVGVGSNASGSGFPQTGFRLYAPGDVAAVRVKNNTNTLNRVVVSYSWTEIFVYQTA